jgi:predicted AlkP superfamily phosphohydrolase/phosphomutase
LGKEYNHIMTKPPRPIPLLIPLLLLLVFIGGCFFLSLLFPPKPQVIIVGLDGVPSEIAESMMARGELPNLASIAERGNFSKFLTHPFSHTRLVWPIIYTGVGPERNGISVDIASEFEKIAITPSMRIVPAIWDVVADAGGRATVISLYESYPAERTDNVLEISDRIWNLPDLTESPPEAFSSDKVRDWALVRMKWGQKDPWLEHTMNFIFTDAGYNKRISGEIARNNQVIQLVRAQILERLRCDMVCVRDLALAGGLRDCDLMVVYFEGTDIVQHAFNDSIPPAARSLGRRKVEAALRIYDAALGRIMDEARPDSYICVVSDHGFDMADEKVVDFRLRRSVTAERAQELLTMLREAREANGAPLYANVTLNGDTITLTVNPAFDMRHTLSALNFLRKEPDVYPVNIGFSDDHECGIYRQTPEKYRHDAFPPPGIFYLAGPGVAHNKEPGVTTIYDVVPTLVYALGLGVASDLDGRPQLEMFKPGFVRAHPLKSIPAFAPRKNVGNQVQLDNSARLLEMQGLGYLDSK